MGFKILGLPHYLYITLIEYKLFSSASIGPSQDIEGFHLSVANFKDDFQKPFKKWARKVLPGRVTALLLTFPSC
jgi:hypothetical protein